VNRCRQVEITRNIMYSDMKHQDNPRIAVKATRGNVVGTHVVDDREIAVLDRHTSAFVFDLAQAIGMTESWVLDFIIETYAKRFGFEPPEE
jgi:hypothetical protein